MIRMRTAAAAALAVLALAGCGTGAAVTSRSQPPATSQEQSAPSARAIASQIGATGYQPITPTLYASDEGNATWHGRMVDIATFASPELRASWVQAAEQFVPIMTEGPQFAIADDGPAA